MTDFPTYWSGSVADATDLSSDLLQLLTVPPCPPHPPKHLHSSLFLLPLVWAHVHAGHVEWSGLAEVWRDGIHWDGFGGSNLDRLQRRKGLAIMGPEWVAKGLGFHFVSSWATDSLWGGKSVQRHSINTCWFPTYVTNTEQMQQWRQGGAEKLP